MTAYAAMETPSTEQSVAELLAPWERIETQPPRKLLFREGTDPEGIYFIHSGEVDLYFSSPRKNEGKSFLIVGPGELLGLTCVMSNRTHDCSAVTRGPCVTGFVEKTRFLRLLEEKPALWLTVLRLISNNINACWECMRNLAAAR